MRFESLRAKGIGPFKNEIQVDFAAAQGPLVAITGENGAGKSTILELLLGAMYRSCPTRGTLASLATSRDSFLEVALVNGASHRIRHVVDNVNGKGESVVTDGEGRPLVASGKMREFDAWSAKHLPTREVLLASSFSAQKAQGFLDMSASERKAILLRVLGIEQYEGLAENARAHVRGTKSELAILDARLADERSRASVPAAVRAALKELQSDRETQLVAVDIAKAEYEALVAKDADYQAAARAAEEQRRKTDALEVRLRDARAKRTDLDNRIANNERVLAQREEIDAAKEAAAKLDLEIDELASRVADARAAEATARADRTAAREAASAAAAGVEQARGRAARLQGRVADKAAVAAAEVDVARLKDEAHAADMAVSATETKIREGSELVLNSATQRIELLREGFVHIRDGKGAANPVATATVVLDDDDTHAAEAAAAPAEVTRLRQLLAEQKLAHAKATRDLAQAEKLAARVGEIAQAEADLTKATEEIAQLEADQKAAQVRFDASDVSAIAARSALDELTKEHDAKKLDRAKIDPLLKRAEPLAQAEARLSELRPQHEAVIGDIAKLESERAELGEPNTPTAAPDIARARDRVGSAERELRSTEGAIAVKESHLVEAEAAALRIAAVEEERAQVLATVADWTLLAESLGRDGLQAMEIDAAGPRLTEIANQLLHDAFGPRFTIRFDLSRKSADGKKDIEGLDVTVIDTEKGREGDAETLSGGEGVIISEAISLALTTIGCARSGVERPTLVRDESGAALDVTRAPAYVRMLRRAAELIGADKVLLVSHSPAVWDLCDSRIEVADGKVRVAA